MTINLVVCYELLFLGEKQMSVIKGVIDSSLPLADEDQSWSASDALSSIKELATNKDGSLNFGVYKKAFFYVADGDGSDAGDYALPFAMVVDGKLLAVWKGVAAAMSALNSKDLVPEADKDAVYSEIGTYYKRFGKDQPELSKSITREVGERVDVLMNIDQSTVKALADGSFSATVTTSDVDRMGESIDTSGINTKTYMNNPVVLYGHDYQGLPIGKTLKLSTSKDPATGIKNKLSATFQLAINEYPFAATVAAMIKGGYLNAVSIGGIVKQWDPTFTKIEQMEMVEFSVVPVPANPNALIGASFEQAVGKSVKEVAKEFHDFVEKSTTEKLQTLDNDELVRHIKSLEDLIAILKSASVEKASESETDKKVTLTIRKSAGAASYHSQEIIKLVKAKKEK
jgi:HK97 family phage prohead protease